MKKAPLLLALALVASGAQAQSMEIITVKALAERPVGLVEGKTCHIRGAVWAYGPRAGVNVILIDVVSAEGYVAKTDANGVYRLDIPYDKPAVLQERLVDAVYIPQERAAKLSIHEGGVVCDHRLSQLISTKEGA